MKFKVGDRVRIASTILYPEMRWYENKVGIVVQITPDHAYPYRVEEFEVETRYGMGANFKEEELKKE